MYFLISYQLIDLYLISFYHVLIVIIYDSFFIVSGVCSTSLLSTLVIFFYGVIFILFLVLRGPYNGLPLYKTRGKILPSSSTIAAILLDNFLDFISWFQNFIVLKFCGRKPNFNFVVQTGSGQIGQVRMGFQNIHLKKRFLIKFFVLKIHCLPLR